MRINVKNHQENYLNTIANQMGTTPAIALDYLLWELKRTGFSFSSPLVCPLESYEVVQSSPNLITPEPETLWIDPAIARIANLLETF